MTKVTMLDLVGYRFGTAAAPKCDAAPARQCPLCGVIAVLPLDLATRQAQPDATNAVCHPMLGGCNHGFELAL